jgi:hypothetical protein
MRQVKLGYPTLIAHAAATKMARAAKFIVMTTVYTGT